MSVLILKETKTCIFNLKRFTIVIALETFQKTDISIVVCKFEVKVADVSYKEYNLPFYL